MAQPPTGVCQMLAGALTPTPAARFEIIDLTDAHPRLGRLVGQTSEFHRTAIMAIASPAPRAPLIAAWVRVRQ